MAIWVIFLFRFACMDPASLTIVPDIKLPMVDGRQLSPENCVSSNKEVQIINYLIAQHNCDTNMNK